MYKKPILIAEIGGNHEGDFDLALELGSQAIEAGADYIKYQVYTADGLINPVISSERHKHFNRLSLPTEKYIELAKKIEALGGKFLASIWNVEDIKLFANYMDFFKIGSGDLTCYPILKEISDIGKPIVISTGLANMSEVKDAVNFICQSNPDYKRSGMLTIMQCTSMYPTDANDLNLSVINSYKEEFPSHDVGYSHHHKESWPIEVAYTLGANMIEFHFTHDKSIESFRDHQLSLTKNELVSLKGKLELIRISAGCSSKEATRSELNANHIEEFRRGVYVKNDMKIGSVIQEEDLVVLRPDMGISSSEYFGLLGKRTNKNLNAYAPLSFNDFEEF